jgi:phospholipase C
MFMYAETSGSFDENMGTGERLAAETAPGGGLEFRRGTVFGLLKHAGVKYRIYAGDSFPTAAWLDGISVLRDITDFEDFTEDLKDPSFDAGYVHIEPKYDAIFGFGDGNSQHPDGRGSVAAGERLIKAVYEAIRSSPVWEESLLIITWDEHGGFYDHVIPPSAQGTGERGRCHGFTFEQLGPRVPAVVVSPLIPRNLIDHRVHDHTAIPATLRRVFGLPSLGGRDGITGGVDHLAGPVARTDAPMRLPNAAIAALASAPRTAPPRPAALISEDSEGMAASTLNSALAQHLEVTPAEQHAAITARVRSLRTHADAFAYLKEVEQLVREKRLSINR